MVDADHGYGNALNVMRTVQELETAGVAGADDRGHRAAARVRREEAQPDLASRKASARCAPRWPAREDKALVIIGRTSAAAITGMEDAHRARQGL